MSITLVREPILLKWHKVHRDCDGGTQIATAFKDAEEPLLFFIRRCQESIHPKWRMSDEVDGWDYDKVNRNGIKYLVFSFPCHINSPYDCTGQVCSNELFVSLGANGLVVFMREYKYDV